MWLGGEALRTIVLENIHWCFGYSCFWTISELLEEGFKFLISLEDLWRNQSLVLGKVALNCIGLDVGNVVQGYSCHLITNLLSKWSLCDIFSGISMVKTSSLNLRSKSMMFLSLSSHSLAWAIVCHSFGAWNTCTSRLFPYSQTIPKYFMATRDRFSTGDMHCHH